MIPQFLLPLSCLLAAALHYGAYWVYSRKVVPKEVSRNLADILSDGSNDSLRKGYHARRTWVRFWPWLGCSVVPNLPLLPLGWLPALLGLLGLGLLLAGYFARYFTPLLNISRNLDEFRASSDSASWPDALIWKQVRAETANLGIYDRQSLANKLLKALLTRTWLLCRLGYGVLVAGAVVVALVH